MSCIEAPRPPAHTDDYIDQFFKSLAGQFRLLPADRQPWTMFELQQTITRAQIPHAFAAQSLLPMATQDPVTTGMSFTPYEAPTSHTFMPASAGAGLQGSQNFFATTTTTPFSTGYAVSEPYQNIPNTTQAASSSESIGRPHVSNL